MQPAIDLGKGVRVRLGIEAAECPADGGVLVYCIAEGYDGSCGAGWRVLGPVRLDVRRERPREIRHIHQKLGRLLRLDAANLRKSRALFARAAAVTRAGKYRISVQTAKGREIAFARLLARQDAASPWMPWLMSKPGPNPKHKVPNWYVENGRAGPAVPRWDGSRILVREPLGEKTHPKLSPQTPLPACLPERPVAGVKTTVQGNAVTIAFPAGSLGVQSPRQQFLTRWWVNGRPVMPKPARLARLNRLEQEIRAVQAFNPGEYRLHVILAPDRLGAKTGDRVRLQLLYCRGGWEWSCPGFERLSRLLIQDTRRESRREDESPTDRAYRRAGVVLLDPVEFVVR